MKGLLGCLLLMILVGHWCIWFTFLNHVYARPISKKILKPYRLFCGCVMFAGLLALVAWLLFGTVECFSVPALTTAWGTALFGLLLGYLVVCFVFGGLLFPWITWTRWTRRPPRALRAVMNATVDFYALKGNVLIGNGKWPWLPRLPGNCLFQVEFTDLTLAVPALPPAWEGLTVLHLSDLHFHGTPSYDFFEAIMKRLQQDPLPDLILCTGDLVDSDEHRAWIVPLLGSLDARHGKFAVLGNHDEHHDPEAVRAALRAAGYTVLGNSWQEVALRGVRCLFIGHEGPWFKPLADLSAAPVGCFRWLVAHSPDAYFFAQKHEVHLMVAGHVHGGQIRLPLVGSLFVPSLYGRRYDEGVFQKDATIMVVSRGISGKEPLRYRCRPQVLRFTLTGTELSS